MCLTLETNTLCPPSSRISALSSNLLHDLPQMCNILCILQWLNTAEYTVHMFYGPRTYIPLCKRSRPREAILHPMCLSTHQLHRTLILQSRLTCGFSHLLCYSLKGVSFKMFFPLVGDEIFRRIVSALASRSSCVSRLQLIYLE